MMLKYGCRLRTSIERYHPAVIVKIFKPEEQ